MDHFTRWMGGALLLAHAGCGTQVESDYRGEPLAVLRGAVVSQEVAFGQDVVPMLGWYGLGLPDANARQESPSLLQAAEVTGTFPNQFSIRLYEPPPPEALVEDEDGVGLAVAYIFAVHADEDLSVGLDTLDGQKPAWFAGGAANYMMMYLSKALAPGSRGADWFGMPLPAGFHTLQLAELTEEEAAARFACSEDAYERSLPAFNAQYGTAHQNEADLSEQEWDDFEGLMAELEHACQDAAGLPRGKVRMTPIPADGSQELTLRMGTDIQYLDWR